MTNIRLGTTGAAVLFAIGVITVTPLLAQQPSTNAAFDVTSVKPSEPGADTFRMSRTANGGMQAEGFTLGTLVRMVFQLQDNQIAGGPKWLFESRYDVVGTGAAPGRDGLPLEKMKSLLVDKFKLVTHVETREQPLYALVLARTDGKLGEKIKMAANDCSPVPQAGPPAAGDTRCRVSFGPGRVMGGVPMTQLATMLARFVGRSVVDKTGLKGTYDIELSFAPETDPSARDLGPDPGRALPTASGDTPSIFSALQEQLGLKLEPTRGPVDVLVIDRAEKPTQD